MTMTKEQIKKEFVSEVKNIGEYVYNNQDWYQEDTQRMRYILATIEMSPGDPYSSNPKQLELGQEDNRFYDCISFEDNGMYKIKNEKKLFELINMTDEAVRSYIETNEYIFSIMNHWQDVIEFDTEDYDNCDQMTVTKRARQWNVDPETGYKSENKFEVAYSILMEHWEHLPDDAKEDINKRLEAVGC